MNAELALYTKKGLERFVRKRVSAETPHQYNRYIIVIFSMQDLAYCGHLSKQQEAASYSAAVQSPFQFILMRREKLGLAHLLFSYEPLQTFIVCFHGYWIVCQAVFLAVCFIFL